jgi:hypothetical protein
MVPYVPTLHSVVLVGLFAVLYLAVIGRKTVRGKLDLYDLCMLSMVAVVPALFTFFPAFAGAMAEVAGVAFPFVVMFGLLLAVLFTLVHRLTGQMHRVEEQNCALIQEVSLLQLELQAAQKASR